MRNSKLTPIVYEYRYSNLSDTVRNSVIENRHSLFERCGRSNGKVSQSSGIDTLIAKLGIISGIALIFYIVSIIV